MSRFSGRTTSNATTKSYQLSYGVPYLKLSFVDTFDELQSIAMNETSDLDRYEDEKVDVLFFPVEQREEKRPMFAIQSFTCLFKLNYYLV